MERIHVSDGLSVHHQESKTVHTASGVCQIDSADCFASGSEMEQIHVSDGLSVHHQESKTVHTA